MSEDQPHLSVRRQDDVCLVEFRDRKILEELSIREIEDQLFELVEAEDNIKILLSFKSVEHLSSAALGMLINLEKLVGRKNGQLILSDINPQIFEVFKITRLNRMFQIHPTAQEALKRF